MAPDPYDQTSPVRVRLRALAAWLDATPAEVLGLALLLAGGALVTALVWSLGDPQSAPPPPLPMPQESPSAEVEIAVHVAGAVKRPGLVRLPRGARVADALEAAGGTTPEAVLDALNLARQLSDGDQVVVPVAGAAPPAIPAAGAATTGTGARRPDGRLDLNRASADELEELPGIGEVLAARIVEWRQEHGPFTSVGQLREVPGIGERIFQNLADLLSV
ncbi:MAG: helix-hairpin-helix domain-containing protein [Nitriliruptorales bacterium]